MTDLEALAARVEEAKGPDRELDAAIMAVLFRREDRHIGTTEEDAYGKWVPVTDAVWINPTTSKWVSTHPHRFTASLDAAMTLLPANKELWMQVIGGAATEARVIWLDDDMQTVAEAATPALALAAAALRATAHQEQQS